MKEGIHPKYGVCTVSCACGNTFQTRSTLNAIRVEICSNCHPFYTGTQKLIDTAGRVEKFRRRFKSNAPAAAGAAQPAAEPAK
jgi:large subunit ribosomal protein L31